MTIKLSSSVHYYTVLHKNQNVDASDDTVTPKISLVLELTQFSKIKKNSETTILIWITILFIINKNNLNLINYLYTIYVPKISNVYKIPWVSKDLRIWTQFLIWYLPLISTTTSYCVSIFTFTSTVINIRFWWNFGDDTVWRRLLPRIVYLWLET